MTLVPVATPGLPCPNQRFAPLNNDRLLRFVTISFKSLNCLSQCGIKHLMTNLEKNGKSNFRLFRFSVKSVGECNIFSVKSTLYFSNLFSKNVDLTDKTNIFSIKLTFLLKKLISRKIFERNRVLSYFSTL